MVSAQRVWFEPIGTLVDDVKVEILGLEPHSPHELSNQSVATLLLAVRLVIGAGGCKLCVKCPCHGIIQVEAHKRKQPAVDSNQAMQKTDYNFHVRDPEKTEGGGLGFLPAVPGVLLPTEENTFRALVERAVTVRTEEQAVRERPPLPILQRQQCAPVGGDFEFADFVDGESAFAVVAVFMVWPDWMQLAWGPIESDAFIFDSLDALAHGDEIIGRVGIFLAVPTEKGGQVVTARLCCKGRVQQADGSRSK